MCMRGFSFLIELTPQIKIDDVVKNFISAKTSSQNYQHA